MAENVFPTKGNLINARKSLALAQVGYDLMERKRKILMGEVAKRTHKLEKMRLDIELLSRDAFFLLRLATVANGLPLTSAGAVPVDDSVQVAVRSVMGVEVCTASVEPTELKPYYGLNFTGLKLDEAYEKFNELKILLVEYAALDSSISRLNEAVNKTVKRSNALGNIVIPKFTSRIRFISSSLEEKEREEFARLKVIKGDK